ncbi:MAG: Gfo/Idh/MocA family oxidoreductase [Verrucomicrobiales bacterium]|nr:Gfo/Idh/MocA family oxidoreductase [Verrucomicrobiales bacterium]
MKRRSFLRQSMAAAAAPFAGPAILSAKSPNSFFHVAAMGVGGMAGNTMRSVAQHDKVKVVGLCDVDSKTMEIAQHDFPDAKAFVDYREMLTALGDTVDAVTIGTPDHMHAPMAVTSLRAGKHVYLQKPLTHHVMEARVLGQEAAKAGVITQMGTQLHSSIESRMTAEMIQSGKIGRIKEVLCWENKPSSWWPKDTTRRQVGDPVPATLDWDRWLGVADVVPYQEGAYHPKQWRAWVDFGVGMMGDMGCHYFDLVFACLKLGSLNRVRSLGEISTGPLYAKSRHLELEFPGSDLTVDDTVKITWTDGDAPYAKDKVIQPAALKKEAGSCVYFIGEKGAIYKPHNQRPWLVPDANFTRDDYLTVPPANHYTDWVDACMAGQKAATDLPSYACPLTEAVLLGVLAERHGGDWIEWDAAAAQITNKPELNAELTRKYRDGWQVEGLG